jgi:hypothetical protein
MTDVPSAAPGRAAAATNWQSIFTVAATIGVALDADMRALALGGDPHVQQAAHWHVGFDFPSHSALSLPQLLRQFVDDILVAIDKAKHSTAASAAPSAVASKPSSAVPAPQSVKSRAPSTSLPAADSSNEAQQCLISVNRPPRSPALPSSLRSSTPTSTISFSPLLRHIFLKVLVPCVAPQLVVQEHELMDFFAASSSSPAAAARALGAALAMSRPVEGLSSSSAASPPVPSSKAATLPHLSPSLPSPPSSSLSHTSPPIPCPPCLHPHRL